MLIIMIMWWGNCEFCQEFALSSFPIKVVSGDNSLFWLMHCYEDADYTRDHEWVFSAPHKEIVILDPFQHNHHKAKAGLWPAKPNGHLASPLRCSVQEGKVLIFRDTHRHFVIIYISSWSFITNEVIIIIIFAFEKGWLWHQEKLWPRIGRTKLFPIKWHQHHQTWPSLSSSPFYVDLDIHHQFFTMVLYNHYLEMLVLANIWRWNMNFFFHLKNTWNLYREQGVKCLT